MPERGLHSPLPFKAARWMALGIGVIILAATFFLWPGKRIEVAGKAAEKAEKSPHKQAESTLKMAARLRQLADSADPKISIYNNADRAKMYRTQLEAALRDNPQDFKKHLPIRYQLGVESLLAGYNEDAIRELSLVLAAPQIYNVPFSKGEVYKIRQNIAMAFLRSGEQENCLCADRRGAASCLLPIQGDGVHTVQNGSRSAIPLLLTQLREKPDDLTNRWLLNIAYMTIGEYPDKVPEQWRIDPKVFASDADIGRFPEIGAKLGVNEQGLSGGVIAEDFDGDGLTDILCSHLGLREQMRLFKNNGDGTFTDKTEDAGLMGITGGLNMLLTDYDNDGNSDVFMLRGAWMGLGGRQPNSLLRNNGDGTFVDVTEQAGLLSFHPTQTGTWFDYDGDGWLDLFIGNESAPDDPHPCELYHNNRDGTFTECAQKAGVDLKRFVKGVTSGDYDKDCRPDLYVSCLDGSNVLLRNAGLKEGNWTFEDVTATAGVGQQKQSFPTWFFDYDNDGWEDLFVAGFGPGGADSVCADYLGLPTIGERCRIYHNNGNGTFTDRSVETKMFRTLLPMGSNFGDVDNDGYLDMYLGTGYPYLDGLDPCRLFRNAGGKFFQDVTTSAGVGHLQKGHAVAFADFDHDGDQDIYESMGAAYSGDTAFNVFYENPGHGNHWLSLKLSGVASNRAALGARIKVTLKTPAGTRVVHRTVSTGGSFGCSPLRQEIGLGDATAVENLQVFWPATGKTQEFRDLVMDRGYKIREGDNVPAPMPLKTFRLAGSAATTPAPGSGTN